MSTFISLGDQPVRETYTRNGHEYQAITQEEEATIRGWLRDIEAATDPDNGSLTLDGQTYVEGLAVWMADNDMTDKVIVDGKAIYFDTPVVTVVRATVTVASADNPSAFAGRRTWTCEETDKSVLLDLAF